ncbi:MAG: DUF4142 domain-containing protein [Flavobacteriales bacterium]
MDRNTVLLFAAAMAGMQACSNGQGQTDSATTQMDTAMVVPVQASPTAMAMADTAFVKKIAIGGMAEVELGKMAADRGMDTKVKTFGTRMVTDHGKANDELKSITETKNIQLPTDMDAEHKTLIDSLSKLSGKAFDTAYVNAMLDGHKKTLAILQEEAANGTDADLKAFAAKTATVVQEHLTLIQQIQEGLK